MIELPAIPPLQRSASFRNADEFARRRVHRGMLRKDVKATSRPASRSSRSISSSRIEPMPEPYGGGCGRVGFNRGYGSRFRLLLSDLRATAARRCRPLFPFRLRWYPRNRPQAWWPTALCGTKTVRGSVGAAAELQRRKIEPEGALTGTNAQTSGWTRSLVRGAG